MSQRVGILKDKLHVLMQNKDLLMQERAQFELKIKELTQLHQHDQSIQDNTAQAIASLKQARIDLQRLFKEKEEALAENNKLRLLIEGGGTSNKSGKMPL